MSNGAVDLTVGAPINNFNFTFKCKQAITLKYTREVFYLLFTWSVCVFILFCQLNGNSNHNYLAWHKSEYKAAFSVFHTSYFTYFEMLAVINAGIITKATSKWKSKLNYRFAYSYPQYLSKRMKYCILGLVLRCVFVCASAKYSLDNRQNTRGCMYVCIRLCHFW